MNLVLIFAFEQSTYLSNLNFVHYVGSLDKHGIGMNGRYITDLLNLPPFKQCKHCLYTKFKPYSGKDLKIKMSIMVNMIKPPDIIEVHLFDIFL